MKKYTRCLPVTISAILVVCSLSLLTITACKKGDTGPKGDTGAKGDAGPNGPKGTANVIYSDWAFPVANSMKDSIIDGSSSKIARLNAPNLVDSILNKGTVLVYTRFITTIFTLPYTSVAGGKVNTLSFIPALKSILLYRFTHDNSNSSNISTSLEFRYILIPGGVAAGRLSKPDYANMSYEEVCASLGIPL